MSGPNVDQATGLAGSPFHRMSQEPVVCVCRNAMVRYLAPDALLTAAGLASVYAWKYGEKTCSGIARRSFAAALPPPATSMAITAMTATTGEMNRLCGMGTSSIRLHTDRKTDLQSDRRGGRSSLSMSLARGPGDERLPDRPDGGGPAEPVQCPREAVRVVEHLHDPGGAAVGQRPPGNPVGRLVLEREVARAGVDKAGRPARAQRVAHGAPETGEPLGRY